MRDVLPLGGLKAFMCSYRVKGVAHSIRLYAMDEELLLDTWDGILVDLKVDGIVVSSE